MIPCRTQSLRQLQPLPKLNSAYSMSDCCVNAETMDQLVTGELPARLQGQVREHLRQCRSCQQRLQQRRSEEDLFKNICWAFQPSESELNTAGVRQVIESTGEYTVESLCGRGGQGLVFKARHNQLKRQVAIKVIRRGRENDLRAVHQFSREMEAIGTLDHRNIIRAYDAREIEGVRLLTMEFVSGSDLGNRLLEEGPFSIAKACELARQAALGLQHAHDNQVVHGDVKPKNLLLSDDGTVKILDLGLVHLQSAIAPFDPSKCIVDDFELVESSPMKNLGADERTTISGTPEYMAPEQWNRGPIDARTDIYGLGCTLFHLLTGTPPFGGEGFPTLKSKMIGHTNSEIPKLTRAGSNIPDSLAKVVYKMLAKQPENRYASASQVADCLAEFCPSDPSPQVKTKEGGSSASDKETSVFTYKLLWRLAVASLAIVSVVFGIYLLTAPPPPPEVVIGGFDKNRGGLMCLKSGQGVMQLRSELTEKFPGARLVESNELTAEFLASVDVLFISSGRSQHETTKLSKEEQVALRNFVCRGGGAIILIDNDSFGDQNTDMANESFIDSFGLDSEGSVQGFQEISIGSSSHPLFDGQFGKAEKLKVFFPGYFSHLGEHAVAIGDSVETRRGPYIAVIDRGKLAPGSGRIVFLADTGPFIDVENLFMQNDNAVFALNAFDWVKPELETAQGSR